MEKNHPWSIPFRQMLAELIGTALLLLAGLSVVIVMFGTGSVMARVVPAEGLRRLITGFVLAQPAASLRSQPSDEPAGPTSTRS